MSHNQTPSQFVSELFERLLFQGDGSQVVSIFEKDIAADARININGQGLSPAQFLDSLKEFHNTTVAKLTAPMEDLAVVPLDAAGHSAVLGRVVKTKHTNKTDGKVFNQVGVTIIKVEEKGGRNVVTTWASVQQKTAA
ncbi:hypothetical protein FB451DRAFT_1270889 [Mycena latifolia]|nr:hypothetical protein FB451DRAFT_1270889 [Mycena latifolia]